MLRSSLNQSWRIAGKEWSEEPAPGDDPVRVYLKEMGIVSLLNREGKSRWRKRWARWLAVRKALSKLPLIWRSIVQEPREGNETSQKNTATLPATSRLSEKRFAIWLTWNESLPLLLRRM